MGGKFETKLPGMVPLALVLALLAPTFAAAEEVLAPRGREAYEQSLRELEAKYGAKPDAAMKAELSAAGAGPVAQAEPVAAASVAASGSNGAAMVSGNPAAGIPPGSKLRIALAPLGADRFSFGGESLDSAGLQLSLDKLAQTYRLDTLVLLETDTPIQARHLVELSRLSAHFKIPALFQRGQTLLAVSAAGN